MKGMYNKLTTVIPKCIRVQQEFVIIQYVLYNVLSTIN